MGTSQQPLGGALADTTAPAAPRFRVLRAVLIVVAFAVAAVVPLAFASSYQLFQLTLAVTYAIAILGLNIVTGFNGQISLGHGAFYAVGAYTTAILMSHFDVPYWATLPIAALICGVIGFGIGFPALRLGGLYLALTTFSLAVAVPQILKYKAVEDWTGGVQGAFLVKPDAPAFTGLDNDQYLYLFVLVIAALLFIMAANLLHSRIGRAMRSIRDHPTAAEAMGMDIARIKTRTFALSAGITGLAGALSAIAVEFVAPGQLQRRTLDQPVRRHGGGRRRLDHRPDLRRGVRRLPAQPRGVGLARGARRHLRRHPDLLPLPAAAGFRGLPAQDRGAAPPAPPGLNKTTREDQNMMQRRTILAASAAMLAAPRLARAVTVGVTATEIKIGNFMPYSGPASAYGVIGRGDAAFFKMVNDQGGVGGRQINFISYDDGYSPPRSVEQTRRLVEQDRVALLFHTLGTPTNSAVVRYVNQRRVPHLFLATGADKWGNYQETPWTIGWQPSYRTEAQIYAKSMLEQKPNAKVALLYQNDDFGKDYVTGVKDVLGAPLRRHGDHRVL